MLYDYDNYEVRECEWRQRKYYLCGKVTLALVLERRHKDVQTAIENIIFAFH